VRAITDSTWNGSYNVCAPEQPDNRTFMRTLARVLHRPFVSIGVPGFAMKAVMGEQADLLLEGSRYAGEKVKAAGWEFVFSDLEPTLKELLQ
jgi:hypothetical protein